MKIIDFRSSQSLKTMLGILYVYVLYFDYKQYLDAKMGLDKTVNGWVSVFGLIVEESYDK